MRISVLLFVFSNEFCKYFRIIAYHQYFDSLWLLQVFPLHIFEVSANQQVPDNKTMLMDMLSKGTAIPFHKKLCPGCHTVPKAKEWQTAKETAGVHVFHVGKRTGYYVHWEPIFIGSHADPLYDERLSWEGKMDKMTQVCILIYSLCSDFLKLQIIPREQLLNFPFSIECFQYIFEAPVETCCLLV